MKSASALTESQAAGARIGSGDPPDQARDATRSPQMSLGEATTGKAVDPEPVLSRDLALAPQVLDILVGFVLVARAWTARLMQAFASAAEKDAANPRLALAGQFRCGSGNRLE